MNISFEKSTHAGVFQAICDFSTEFFHKEGSEAAALAIRTMQSWRITVIDEEIVREVYEFLRREANRTMLDYTMMGTQYLILTVGESAVNEASGALIDSLNWVHQDPFFDEEIKDRVATTAQLRDIFKSKWVVFLWIACNIPPSNLLPKNMREAGVSPLVTTPTPTTA